MDQIKDAPPAYDLSLRNGYKTENCGAGDALLVIDTGTKAVIETSRYHGYEKENSGVKIGWTFLARSHGVGNPMAT
ncbi:MAG: hypothetical protein OEO18_20665 [Gammaproteobacteria bacterium]|nr:hypothetical protein [Gammaproteobacteria bacterium]